MAWTPPSKFTVFLSFLLLAGGLFILIELIFTPIGLAFPVITVTGFSSFQIWVMIGLGLVFLSWILFLLGVRLKGM
ncbi:MAG: hypothetical protein EAX89_10210 [Candidatus Lokiarchaeota archaeon]|nr:hypothetical protein [Candidatus Lokiarchaeota archaeon]